MASDSVNLVAALGGELVTYTPHGGVAKTFKAIVERGENGQQVQAMGRTYTGKVRILTIPNDATDGVTAIKEGHDTVSAKFNTDDAAPTTFRVVKLLSHDAGLVSSDGGMFRVECHV